MLSGSLQGRFRRTPISFGRKIQMESLLIDPGSEPEKLVDAAEEHGFEPQAIINTYVHLEHIGDVRNLQSTYSIPFSGSDQSRPRK